jgi:excinuclease UvrABC nuclease subunit
MKSGIYCIKNIINDKMYIGSAVNLKTRRYEHFHFLTKNKHHNRHLQS